MNKDFESPDNVKDQLERILANSRFLASQRLSQFLSV
jgi:hypothetical protein